MKKLSFLPVLILSLLLSYSQIYAQRDYQIVQNFKTQYNQIKGSIKSADSLSQLTQISNQINKLKNDFADHKELLDKSLYPDDFDTMINKLDEDLTLRKGDFTQITILKAQVSQLNVQIELLNNKNASLIDQIQQFQEENKKDKGTIARLGRSISELRNSIRKRDRLVMTLIDSLLPSSYKENNKLSKKEKEQIFSEAKKANVIENIKNAINDNIKFLELTTLTPSDINSIKKQQSEFERVWKNTGPKIISIYSAHKQNMKNIRDIDSAFSMWNNAIVQEAWKSIGQKFLDYGINLEKFSNGNEFTRTVISYADDAIKNAKIKGNPAAKNSYSLFVDTLWYGKIKPNWVPYLKQNNMFTQAQQDTIESKLAEWKNTVIPSGFNWLYVVVIVLGIVLIILLVTIIRSSKKKKSVEDGKSEDNE